MVCRGAVASLPRCPALTGVAQQLTPPELRIDHQPRARRRQQPDAALHARLGRRDVLDTRSTISSPTCARGFRQVPTAEPAPLPQNQGAAVEGGALYLRYGCVNCHGISGLGGVPNPQSPDKTIPPLSGPDFRKRVQHRREDHRGDSVRQRDREGADREHAALGRDHPAGPAAGTRRLSEDAQAAAHQLAMRRPVGAERCAAARRLRFDHGKNTRSERGLGEPGPSSFLA